jgi:SUZ domain
VKIMRRTALAGNKASNDGSTAASSSAPSKATSEAGAENTSDEGMPSPPDAISSKDRSKWTREEKEAHYKAARERIFRDFQEAHGSENTTAENSANMSRSSSSSGKRKGHKQKAPRDDSFEARSSYVPGYPGMPYSSQNQHNGQHASGGYHSPYGAQTLNPAAAVSFSSNNGSAYSQYDPPTTFSAMNFPATYPNQYVPHEGWSNPQSPQPGGYYNFGQHPGPGYTPYGSAISSPATQYQQMASPAFQSPNQQWGQPQFQQSYPVQPAMQPPMQPSMGQNGTPMSWPSYPSHPSVPNPASPFQFGQAPFQQYSSTPPPNSQHPLPGSYNRSAFNPQIRSFVPGGPNVRFAGQPGQARPMLSPYAGPGGNSSGQNADKFDPSSRATAAPSKFQESLQKKWGTPAHLPKKPPPSQIPSTFEIENTSPLPSQQSFPLASSMAKASPAVGNN